jgi:hypothetical protein
MESPAKELSKYSALGKSDMDRTTRYLRDLKGVITKRWVEICLMAVIVSYVIFQYVYLLPLPVIGVHGWNESVYLSIMENSFKHNDPFLFQAAYDPYRPDYNVGFVFFWGTFVFLKTIGNFVFIDYFNFQFFSRWFSLICTVASALMLYLLMKMVFRNKPISLFVSALFLVLPLTIHFGAKYQLEPFIFAMFLASVLLLTKFVFSRKFQYLIGSYVLYGLMLGTRQNMIVYLPALLCIQGYMFITRENGKLNIQGFKRWLYSKELIAAVSLTACFTLLPAVITNLVYPQFVPLDFFIGRMFLAPQMASYTTYQQDIISIYIQKSLIPSLGFSFVYLLLSLPILYFTENKSVKVICFGLYLSGLAYFLIAFNHDIIHMFHSYYFLLPVLLGAAVFANYIRKKGRKIACVVLISALLLQGVQSFLVVQNYYGITTDNVYTAIDGYGNAYSVLAGCFINKFCNFLEEESLVSQASVSYVLVQSPAVYFYTKIPSFSYYDFYTWSSENKNYSQHEFFVNTTEFTQAAEARNLTILTVTPDVSYHLYREQGGEAFLVFMNNYFEHLCDVGDFSIYLNKTIFRENQLLIKAQSMEILREIENSSLCPIEITEQVLNSSVWYRVSILSEKASTASQVLNDENHTFEIDPVDGGSFTIFMQAEFKEVQNFSTIFGITDFFNVKMGGGNDVYLELPKTEQGYRYTQGVQVSQYLWQNLSVIFVYDVVQERAETYFGNVLMSSSLHGIPNGTFSELIDPVEFNLEMTKKDEYVQLYHVMIWNKALSLDEVNSLFSGTIPEELVFNSAR